MLNHHKVNTDKYYLLISSSQKGNVKIGNLYIDSRECEKLLGDKLTASSLLTLREKCPNTELFLVGIFLYSDRIQENTDQK